ncbi:MAG: MBL fold metallo-hydrolase [Salaquimonas sp.]|nr:MBL fold metallo-hydrolase [Salaquimonas sp.]
MKSRSGTRRPNPYYQGPVSDHFDGAIFFNPGGVAPGNVRELLKWRLANKPAQWPKQWPSSFHDADPAERVDGDGLTVTMIGHATLLIQTAGLNMLTDPVWSDRVSPLSFAGPKRVNSPGIAKEKLPPVDIVLLSHNHYDHLDLPTLAWLVARDDPLIVTPLGNDTIVRARVPAARFAVGDWGDIAEIGKEVRIHFEPVHHWSARGVRDRRMALWAGFVVQTPAGRILHVGDTGFHEGRNFTAAAEKHGAFRLAILPIGAYEPRWFMEPHHMNPDEAVRAFKLANAAHALGHHWGTFQLTNEAIDAPLLALEEALATHDVDPARFPALRPGQTLNIPLT